MLDPNTARRLELWLVRVYDFESIDQMRSWLFAKSGRCEICDAEVAKLVADHDHQTETLRGLLCYRCNNSLGRYESGRKTDPIRALAFLKYLERSKTNIRLLYLVRQDPRRHRSKKPMKARLDEVDRVRQVEESTRDEILKIRSLLKV